MKDKEPLYYSWNCGVSEIELDVLTGIPLNFPLPPPKKI
jgi:hypothetical protein